jgi:hypothetical protein
MNEAKKLLAVIVEKAESGDAGALSVLGGVLSSMIAADPSIAKALAADLTGQ